MDNNIDLGRAIQAMPAIQIMPINNLFYLYRTRVTTIGLIISYGGPL